MSRSVEYYFSLTSTWAYVGQRPFAALAERHGLTVIHRPVPLHDLFESTGGLPLSRRHPSRKNYRFLELQRWREAHDLSFNLRPQHWPLQSYLADKTVLAALQRELDVAPLLEHLFSAIWEREENLDDADALVRIVSEAGFDGVGLVAAAADPAHDVTYHDNLARAVAAGVFGSPSFVLDGELFWGQDRLDLLEFALESGRKPYAVP